MKKWGALAGVLISVLLLGIMLARLDFAGVVDKVRRVGWGNWIIGAGIYLSAFLPRGRRWKLMLPEGSRLPYGGVTQALVIGFAANNLLPFRLGELVRSYLIGERFNLSKLTCLATIAAEKVLDGCCLLAILAVCLPALRLGAESAVLFQRTFFLTVVLFGLAAAGGAALAIWGGPITRLADRFFPRPAARLIQAGGAAMGIFRQLKVFAGAAAFTLLIWLLEGACFVFFSDRMGIKRPGPTGLFCLVIVNLSILVPSAPGYVGTFQAGAVAAFLALGLEASSGLALGTVTHAAQFIPTTLLGLGFASRWGLNWRRLYHLKDE